LPIVVPGATGTGKTTLLNVLATAIPPAERVVTIEEASGR
jgi:pilus assembly protein CpaF